ncbi:acyl-CoA dehydrogenase family protein [Candidatus Woesearchaeota archaeon]|nr:acyl-CoA dehydrogenase family protein [Candidatus Woesearchaeota archaeon]
MALDADIRWHIQHTLPDPDTGSLVLESIDGIAAEAGSHAHEGDEIGARLVNEGGVNRVVYPPGVMEAYRELGNNGLLGLSTRSAGLPFLLSVMGTEILSGAYSGLALIPIVTDGAMEYVERFAPPHVKERVFGKLLGGEYIGAMAMTEAGAGSDLRAMRTVAEPITEGPHAGKYRINGTKMFITNPGADVMVVQVKDKGRETLSVMLVLREEDGKMNGVRVSKLENKLGIHSSPTGAVEFEDALGYLLGPQGKGQEVMYDIMNLARTHVAAQATGLASAAVAYTLRYADGDQNNDFKGARVQGGKRIAEHGNVAARLMEMQARVEVMRALTYDAAQASDRKLTLERRLADEAQLQGDAEFMQELAKARDVSVALACLSKYYAGKAVRQVTLDAIDLMGGHGYIRDHPVERFHRDGIIPHIYEGTGDMQAKLDLAMLSKGKLETVVKEIRDTLQEYRSDVMASDFADRYVRIDINNPRASVCEYLNRKLEVIDPALARLRKVSDPDDPLFIPLSREQAWNDVATLLAQAYSAHLLLKSGDPRKAQVALQFLVAESSPEARLMEGPFPASRRMFEHIMYAKPLN